MSELCEKAWRNYLDAERCDIDDLIDLLASIEDALEFNPYLLGVPHADYANNGLWIYSSPPVSRLPNVYVLYEIDDANALVTMWASHFP